MEESDHTDAMSSSKLPEFDSTRFPGELKPKSSWLWKFNQLEESGQSEAKSSKQSKVSIIKNSSSEVDLHTGVQDTAGPTKETIKQSKVSIIKKSSSEVDLHTGVQDTAGPTKETIVDHRRRPTIVRIQKYEEKKKIDQEGAKYTKNANKAPEESSTLNNVLSEEGYLCEICGAFLKGDFSFESHMNIEHD